MSEIIEVNESNVEEAATIHSISWQESHKIFCKSDCELWDAYNRDFEKVSGVTLVRGNKIPSGLFHLVCDIIVRHKDGEYLLMQRDFYKHFGGMWEATAGGSALKGESALACARRELKEETGIESGNLREIGRVVREENQSLYVEYLCETDSDKSAIRLQKGETVAFKWVSAKELREMKKAELVTQRIQQFIDELK